MKKFFAALVSVALMVTAVAFTSSCQKDINNAKSLIGTLWICHDSVEGTTYELTFTSTTDFKMTYNNSQQVTGVYIITGNMSSLAGSSILLTPDDAWSGHESMSGKFETESKLVLDRMIFNRSVK